MGHKIADYIRDLLAQKPAGEDAQYDDIVGTLLEELPKLERDAIIGATLRRTVELNINAPTDRVRMELGFSEGQLIAAVLQPEPELTLSDLQRQIVALHERIEPRLSRLEQLAQEKATDEEQA